MARYLDPVCKRCRREGIKLYLKGARCESPKCPISKDAPPPGMHGMRRSKLSEYGIRLREKQKLKFFYGLLERQFRRYFSIAARSPSNTGEVLLSLMERRLDNIVHRLGLAPSRAAARQMVSHGHIYLNGRVCTIPSRLLKVGDKITAKPSDNSLKVVREGMKLLTARIPDFLTLTGGENPEGEMIRVPSRTDVDERIRDIREQLIIELVTR